MTPRGIIALGALLAGLAVAIGAFGAHGLQGRVAPPMLAVFETGVRYHFYHAFALVLVGLFGGSATLSAGITGALAAAAWCFLAGIAVFSGSLYVLVLTEQRWIGAITPIGGLAFIAGWVLFARAALAR